MLKNALVLYLTAKTLTQTAKWVDHFVSLLQYGTLTRCKGVWQGGYETTQKLEHTSSLGVIEFTDLVSTVCKELRLYQIGAEQEATLLDVCLSGVWYTSGLLRNQTDYDRFDCEISQAVVDTIWGKRDLDVEIAMKHGFPLP